MVPYCSWHRSNRLFMNDDAPQTPEHDDSPDVVRALVKNHRQFLGFLEKRVGDRQIAEDILQEAFARGLHRADQLRSEESAVAWFYRTLRNAVVDHHRRRAAADRGAAAFAAELQTSASAPEDVRGAICQCVRELTGTLKPEYAAALSRIEIDGLAVKDYAAEAGITSNNAAVRVLRAREALRRQVARSCGTCADHGCLDCTCERSPGSCGGAAAETVNHGSGSPAD